VDQEEVDVLQPQPLQRLLEGTADIGRPVGVVVQLGGDVELLARQGGRGDRRPHAGLVGVHLGGVDVAVAGLQGGADHTFGLRWRDLEGAEAELGDRGAVVEGE
jgi:hypothetical protein